MDIANLKWQNVAEVELSYRQKVKSSQRPQLRSSAEVADLLRLLWNQNKIEFVEQFKVLLLNQANRVLGVLELSTGGVTATVADPKIIFVAALKANACGIIISHNHPSGNVKPSRADEELTEKIKNAGKFLDIKLLDHIIISNESYFSFTDEGLL